MSDEEAQFMTKEKFTGLEKELRELKLEVLPRIAKRIDDARQMGDLSENAEYHAAREEMAWTQSRVNEIQYLLSNAEIISTTQGQGSVITIGSTVIVESKNGKKEYVIVGAQEADPVAGKISNESPLGSAFLGKKKGEKIKVKLPSGEQEYRVLEVK
ncbi:MAG: transcription elongation factor GreA [Candidatus Magasanikbacteria bacterium]|nr:transcription elongation factor GreA [Candidatus Magasanikbacteria bacterium]